MVEIKSVILHIFRLFSLAKFEVITEGKIEAVSSCSNIQDTGVVLVVVVAAAPLAATSFFFELARSHRLVFLSLSVNKAFFCFPLSLFLDP